VPTFLVPKPGTFRREFFLFFEGVNFVHLRKAVIFKMPAGGAKSPVTREQFHSHLKLLRFKRDQFKSSIHAAFSLSEELNASESDIFSHPRLQMFLARCSQLEAVYSAFCGALTEIFKFCHECGQGDACLVDRSIGEEVEERYYFILSIYRRVSSPPTVNESAPLVKESVQGKRSRLPTIEIPRFSGAFSDWV
jgi:hypothetical protein